ncbi:signal recognition particle protein [Feifania hominis]|uniref:Signal recognition particle protein n=1 Tax=Feifania hominis TaxID=2763660 RepID=A0A926DC70_9FIRM|nr:signal recognition particle protein [Feifania hominis]MBC8535167.1 signal recognition particle protein [Feifania hominis]
MGFESLTEKLSAAFKKLKNKGKLTPADIKEAMREVKLALLGADVNIKVVKEFVARVSERAVGIEVLESLTPAQQVIKIVNEELCQMMGGSVSKIKVSSSPPTIVMMTGLQGAGKTTQTGKLAGLYKKQNKRPLLVACDVYRPAAIKQLQVVGEQVGVPVFAGEQGESPVSIAKRAVEHAKRHGNDFVFLDTAGRLHIDEVLIEELKNIKQAVNPTEILLVVDAMTGQDAVNAAAAFNEAIGIDGILLTKMDGDTRGGAALSVKHVTGKPIKFIGVGEKLSDIEEFHPDRMASRILGMGDVLTLIEKAQESFDEKKAAELEQKIRRETFDLTDFLDQLRQFKSMGSMDQVLSMLPGVNASQLSNAKIDEGALAKTEAMILSMTDRERLHPEIINGSRKQRIAAGSGTRVEDINRMLKQFEQSKKMLKQFSSMGAKRRPGRRGFPFF